MDATQIEAICVSYMNKLIEGLQLELPFFTYVSQVEVAHLIEIHCRLVGLNFNEYTPSGRPWKDVEDIILSLQDRFGANNFHHLNAQLISQRNTKHMLCLLQIFNEIYEHYKNKGHSFTTPMKHDTTLLASSYQNTREETSHTETSWVSNPGGSTSANIDNDSDSSGSGTFEQHKFFIPFTDSELDSSVWESFDRSSIQDEPVVIKSNSYLVGDEKTPQKQYQQQQQQRTLPVAQKRPSQTELMKSPKKTSKTTTVPLTTRTSKVIGSINQSNQNKSSLPSTKQTKLSTVKLASVNKTGLQAFTKSEQQSGTLKGLTSEPKQEHSFPSSPILNQKSNSNVSRASTASGSSSNQDENDGPPAQDSLFQLNVIHDEIQKHIRTQLSKMEKEISSLKHGQKKTCCGGSFQNLKILQKTKQSQSQSQSQPVCYDFFGNPIKERFPMYKRSIIRPTCHTSYPRSKERKKKPSWININLNNVQDSGEEEQNENKNNSTTEHNNVNTKFSSSSSKICEKILNEIVHEIPDLEFDDDTFKKLKKKCKNHIESINKCAFDEESVRNMVMDKLKCFVEYNKSTTLIQKKLDDADKRRRELLDEQVFSKMEDNRKRAEKSAKHGVKKEKQRIREQVRKLVEAKKVESQHIMEVFDEALQHEKISALQLRKDKQEKAHRVTAEADILLKNLQDFYTTELHYLKEEYAILKKHMGPNAENKFQDIKEAARLNIQLEINKCVDKIIQSIASIYTD